MLDVLVHIGKQAEKSQEDNLMLLRGLHFSATLLKHRVPHWGRAAFASTDPTFQPNTPWRRFSALEFIPCQAIGISAKSPLSWSLRGKRKVHGGKKRSKEGTLSSTFRNDQMTLMSCGKTSQTLSCSSCKDLFNSCSALPWNTETFGSKDGGVTETVSDGATQTKVLI